MNGLPSCPMNNFPSAIIQVVRGTFNYSTFNSILNHREKIKRKRHKLLKIWKTTVTFKHSSGSYSNNITISKRNCGKINNNAIWPIVPIHKKQTWIKRRLNV